MAKSRTVAARHSAVRGDLGDLVTRVPLPNGSVSQIDPYLLLAHHGPQIYPDDDSNIPFGPHPHRGFETITFIRKGMLAHGDTGGHLNIVHEGGVQWMTAGSGVVHTEVFPPEDQHRRGEIEILQMWLNLPARLKMTAPAYSGIEIDEMPVIALAGGMGELRLIAGAHDGKMGPIDSLTGVFMAIVELKAGATATLPAPASRNIFCYVVDGAGMIGDDSAYARWQLIEFNADGDTVTFSATSDSWLIFSHADPIGEPVVAQGPFVMNTVEEIRRAVQDYQAGKFGRADTLRHVGKPR